MKKTMLLLGVTLALLMGSLPAAAKVQVRRLTSPDGKLELQVVTDTHVSFCLLRQGTTLIAPSPISMTLQDGRQLGHGGKVTSAKITNVKECINTPFYRKSAIDNEYNQLEIKFKEGYSIQFRLYNQGAAYRFCTSFKDPISVMQEEAVFNLEKDFTCYIPYSNGDTKGFQNSFENVYTVAPLSQFEKGALAFTPLLVCMDNGLKMCLTESDLESYPGMFLRALPNGLGFEGAFAPIPSEIQDHPYRHQQIAKAYSNILANTQGQRTFPWRIMTVAEKDTDLMVNDMVFALGAPNRIGNTDWIKPGKIAWDWWNNWGVTGVDFPVGINTETYKYFIDFAAANGIEYVVLDEGWSSPSGGDIMKSIPEIDLPQLTAYAKSKKVDLILWCVAYVLDKKLDEACRTYSEMGIKGFKVDFMDRDDQQVVDLNYRIAQTAAKYHLMIDFHGMYKPAGMNRTYPNVINFEGIFGLEQSKWSKEDMIQHDVTFPFIRMLSGPVDYTQGGMRNVPKNDFFPIYNNPLTAGTRAHQVATYIVFDNPFVMLCDNPTIYMKEQETTDYIVGIPTVWEDTKILEGELGQYIVSARYANGHWYIGGITNWTPRTLTLDLSFLEANRTYNARIFQDGVNAARHATDYKIVSKQITSEDKLVIHLAPGGGFAICL